MTVSHERYSNTAIILHWLIAVLLVVQLLGGYAMANLLGAGDARFTIYQIHKTIGLLILGLTLGRILWRLVMRPPALSPVMAGWERGLAHLTHFCFYFLLLAIPLSGWAMVSASETGVRTYLFLQEWLPFYHLPLQGVEDAAEDAHELLSWGAFFLLGLHVAGALKHQFMDRQPSLSRMALHETSVKERSMPLARLAVVGVVLLFPVLGVGLGVAQHGATTNGRAEGAAVATVAEPGSNPAGQAGGDEGGDQWAVVYEQSDLSLAFTFAGSQVTGSFSGWRADVSFDPQAPEEGAIEVIIDTRDPSFSDSTLNSQAQGADGFDAEAFPQARFVAQEISRSENGGFVADGALTVKGITHPLSLHFIFDETDGTATATGEAAVNRLDYGIGASGAPTEEWMSHEVTVRFTVTAVRQ